MVVGEAVEVEDVVVVEVVITVDVPLVEIVQDMLLCAVSGITVRKLVISLVDAEIVVQQVIRVNVRLTVIVPTMLHSAVSGDTVKILHQMDVEFRVVEVVEDMEEEAVVVTLAAGERKEMLWEHFLINTDSEPSIDLFKSSVFSNERG